MAPQKPRLIFQAALKRHALRRRFALALLVVLVCIGAAWGLNEASASGLADPLLLDAGRLGALVLGGVFGVVAIVNLVRWRTRKDELVRVFDRGLYWKRGKKDEVKASWERVTALREDVRGAFAGKRALWQSGSVTLTLDDGRALKFTPAHGDLRRYAAAVRPLVGDVLGSRIGQTLREEQPVRLHPQLILWPGGLEIGRTDLSWADVDLQLKNGTLTVLRKTPKGKFVPFHRYPTRSISDLAGFIEIAQGTMRNYQPERFGIKVQGPFADALRRVPPGGLDIRQAPGVLDGVLYRSQLELALARELKARNVRWKYESETLGKKIKVLVDFYIPQLNVWIDVVKAKPDARQEIVLTDIAADLWLNRTQRLFLYLPDKAYFVHAKGVTALSHNEFWLKLYQP